MFQGQQEEMIQVPSRLLQNVVDILKRYPLEEGFDVVTEIMQISNAHDKAIADKKLEDAKKQVIAEHEAEKKKENETQEDVN